MNPRSDPAGVVVDASVLIARCAREPGRYEVARVALDGISERGIAMHAPALAVMECVFGLCRKAALGSLSPTEHAEALQSLEEAMELVEPPEGGDASLIVAAERIRNGYGCSRSADSFYIALAERLLAEGAVEILTFDAALASHAAATCPAVAVTVLQSSPSEA